MSPALDELLDRYAQLDLLIPRALAALHASRCPCCQPWARAEGLRLAAGITQKTRALDGRLAVLGVGPDLLLSRNGATAGHPH